MTWSRVSADEWQPRGIASLEPAAWEALRRGASTSVVAGPGAGKTEFLAQRAVYLLETGSCPPPYRILAISFKTDAAENLAERVRQRCSADHSQRFVSLTFDAFTKSLIDRFSNVLPDDWRPSRPYEIAFFNQRQIEDWLRKVREAAPAHWQSDIMAIQPGRFEQEVLGTSRLPAGGFTPASAAQFVLQTWWRGVLRGSRPSKLTFTSINRLAELLLRTSPHILRALRTTYPFVFLDEFQDTTFAQYDFLMSAFHGSASNITAVGDHKQRIMAWAGARQDAFERFEADFGATRIPLLFNFRSSPELVRVQHVVAQALDAGAIPTQSQAAAELDRDVVQVWVSGNRNTEAEHLASWLANDIAQRQKQPREYALLVRQKADDFEAELKPVFDAYGLGLRNESRALGRTTLQDLLTDEIAKVTLAMLRLGARQKAPQAWARASKAVEELSGVDPEDAAQCLSAEAELEGFLDTLRAYMDSHPPTPEAARASASQVFGFLDEGKIARAYARYQRNDLLAIMREAFDLHLSQCATGVRSWPECLDLFEGSGQIPLMTVHKSKGLEYDTIAFVGLDDQSWWSHSAGNPEGLATFFVALSRAKQRAIFMFCQRRGSRRKVADLYQLLTNAGVVETDLE